MGIRGDTLSPVRRDRGLIAKLGLVFRPIIGDVLLPDARMHRQGGTAQET